MKRYKVLAIFGVTILLIATFVLIASFMKHDKHEVELTYGILSEKFGGILEYNIENVRKANRLLHGKEFLIKGYVIDKSFYYGYLVLQIADNISDAYDESISVVIKTEDELKVATEDYVYISSHLMSDGYQGDYHLNGDIIEMDMHEDYMTVLETKKLLKKITVDTYVKTQGIIFKDKKYGKQYYILYCSEDEKVKEGWRYLIVEFADETHIANGTYVEVIGNLCSDSYGEHIINCDITDKGDKIKDKCESKK